MLLNLNTLQKLKKVKLPKISEERKIKEKVRINKHHFML